MDKKIFRVNALERRKDIKDKEIKSLIIVNKIINLDIYKNSKIIALYKSINDEVITNYLINYSLKCGKIVLLPRVVNRNLLFFKYQENDQLEKSKFNVLAPIYNEFNIVNNIDLIIVPGVCFDKEKNRMGYGKGYYDRYLKDKKVYKIGICYDEMLYESVPINLYDIKMDLVITEKTSLG